MTHSLSPQFRECHLYSDPVSAPHFANTFIVWDSIKYTGGFISPHLPLLQVTHCPLFPLSIDSPTRFAWWPAHGFRDVHSFLTFSVLITFQYFVDSHQIPNSLLFPYLQLRHFLSSLLRNAFPPYFLTSFQRFSTLLSSVLISLIVSSIRDC